ncbi:MAG: transposase [Syntrophales bacterium]
MFRVAPPLVLKKLEAIFRHKVFCMLIARGKISREMIAMLSTWRHSRFHVFCGNRIEPKERNSMEKLARYIIRASFAQERMQYIADEGTVIYSAKRANDRKVFDAPEWLAAMCSHVPNRGEQMVRYYGWYSDVTRGKRRKEGKRTPSRASSNQTGPRRHTGKTGPD